MSVISFLYPNSWMDLECPHRLLNQNFEIDSEYPSLRKASNICLKATPRSDQIMNLGTLLELLQSENEKPIRAPVKKEDFQVVLDVQQFEPHEIEVKVVDNHIVITCKHEDKQDELGWISRQFVRRCLLPEDFNVEQLTSRLSSDGLLIITAPKKQSSKKESERIIKIESIDKPNQQEKSRKAKKDSEEKIIKE